MSNLFFWIGAFLLGVSAIILFIRLIQKQNEPKAANLDFFSIGLGGFIIFLIAFLVFTWLGEFNTGSQSGMLGSGKSLIQAVLDKMTAEIKAPSANPFTGK
ncbi:MAG: hypothetical protein AAB486_03265 [Patescibacteria group bacterium]